MKKLSLLLCLAPLLMATTCDDENHDYRENPCTMEARAGLTVRVSLNGDNGVSEQGITVTAREGSYIEDLFPVFPGTPTFTGAYERVGHYTITVRKAGFQEYVSGVIAITASRCHVIPQQIDVNLLPL